MNQEVEVRDCQFNVGEVHNEGIFILENNADVFTGATDKEDAQPSIRGNEESKMVENYSSSVSHEYSLDI